jgi:hypothetical protein
VGIVHIYEGEKRTKIEGKGQGHDLKKVEEKGKQMSVVFCSSSSASVQFGRVGVGGGFGRDCGLLAS